MRDLPTKKTVRGLFAAEGYLELELPRRALWELDRIEDAKGLAPYSLYLRGQALQKLDRYEEAIEALQKAARAIPEPFNRKVWEELSQCFRHEGHQELADIAELFAADPRGGADRDFSESSFDKFLTDFGSEVWLGDEEYDPWNRSAMARVDDFDQYNFEEDWDEFGKDRDKDSNSSHRKPPRK